MKNLFLSLLLFLFIGVISFAQVTDDQVRQCANILGVSYEALKQFIDSYRPQVSSSEIISIESSILIEEYQANEIRAETLYKGKMLRITGPIVNLRSGFDPSTRSTNYCIIFADNRGVHFIQVFFRNTEINKLANLSIGQIITIVGVNMGKSGFVSITDAVIID